MTAPVSPPEWTGPGNDYRGITERDAVGSPRIGVVIPAYDRIHLLERTLAGFVAQTLPVDRFEVIVADDGSRQDVAGLVQSVGSRLRIGTVRQERDGFGAGRARNLGAAAVGGDVLLFVDSDCIPDPELLERHAWWHARASNLVVVGTRRSIDSSVFSPGDIAGRRADLAAAAGGADGRGEFQPDDWRSPFYRRTQRLLLGDAAFRAGTSANLSLTRERFTAAGGFSPDFRQWGGEDTELVWRAWNDGAFVVPDQRAMAYHQTQDDAADAADARQDSRRRALPLVADRIPHPFYRKAPTPFATVPLITWMVRVETVDEVERTWREVGASGFQDAEIIFCGPEGAVAHIQPLAETNPAVNVVVNDVPQAFSQSIRLARGAYVAMLDARARFDRGLLRKAVDRLHADTRAGAVRFAYRFADGERYLRLDDLLAIDEQIGRHALPLFAVVRRRELMKDWTLLAQPHALWAAALDRMERVELIITESVAIDEPAPKRSLRPRARDLVAAGPRELARAAVKQARAVRGGAAAPTPPGEQDTRIPVEYVGLTGKNNLGDDAVRVAIERLMPWAQIGTDHADPKMLMVGGGTLLNGKRYYLTRMLRQNSPTLERALFGTGVRNPDYWGTTEPMEEWFSFIDSALVAALRGPDSVANLHALGYWRDLPIIGDPALSLEAPAHTVAADGRVVVCPVHTAGNLHGGDDSVVFKALAATIRRLRDEGREVVMLSAFPEDDRWIIELMRDAGDAAMPYVAGYADLDASLALLASADLVIGERLHAAILAAAVGTPFVALEYRPKVLDFTRSIGQEAVTVRTDAMGALDAIVDHVLAERDVVAAALDAPVAEYRRRQRQAADELRLALGG